VRKAFELYSTGRYSLEGLVKQMHRLGLRNRRGGPVSLNGYSTLLKNPFYIGLIRLRKTGETFPGAHQPLVPKTLFDRVQRILDGRSPTRTRVHDVLFRRLLTCRRCEYSLIGERQKGRAYYRCHTKECPTTCVREDSVEEAILERLRPLQFSRAEQDYLSARAELLGHDWSKRRDEQREAHALRLGQIRDRLGRLTDAYLDGVIEKSLFEERKTALLMEQRDLEENLVADNSGGPSVPDRLSEFLELAGSAYSLYKKALPEEKRDLLKIVTSNRVVEGKNVDLVLAQPFRIVAERSETSYGGAYRDRPRTGSRLIQVLWRWFEKNEDVRFQYATRGEDAKGAKATA
jgi:hypothetical protein